MTTPNYLIDRLRSTARVLGLLLLSLPTLATAALGDVPPPVEPGPVLVLEVFTDRGTGEIEIHGDGFGQKSAPVTLGYFELRVTRWSDTAILARLPWGLAPGSYLLTVERPAAFVECEARPCPPDEGYAPGAIGSLGVTIEKEAGFAGGRPQARFGGPEKPQEELGNLQLGVGESSVWEGLTIEFTAVVEDSRCPIDVTCVWAGRVVVAVRLWQGGAYLGKYHLVLGQGSVAARLSAGGHVIELVQVLPLRSTQSTIEYLKYRIGLLITEGPMCEGGVGCTPTGS